MEAIDKSHVAVYVKGADSRIFVSAGGDSDWTEGESENSRESGSEIMEREFSVSESSVEVDLECELSEVKIHVAKVERDCRFCHLSMDSTNHESGIPIELGCSCKDDLAAAHKQCAETWFKIKGNKNCEICGSTAINVVGVNEAEMLSEWNQGNDTALSTTIVAAAPSVRPAETRNFWQGHHFLNFLLACMVFAFVISWLFHFNVPS